MKHYLRLLLIVLLVTLLPVACDNTSETPTAPVEGLSSEPVTAIPTNTSQPEQAEPPAQVDNFDARYTNKLVTLDEMNALAHPWSGDWVTTNPAEMRYDDGLCEAFQIESAPQFMFDNCIFDSSADYNAAVLRDVYAQTSLSVDLTDKSAYTYDADDYFVYGYHETSGLPKYLLLLERDGFVLGTSITTRNFTLGEEPFSAFYTNKEFALDDLLHAVMLINLERLGAQPATSLSGDVFVHAKIVFASKRDGNFEIYTVNTDGSELVRLTNNAALDGEPDWSPDGKHIVFLSNRDGNFEIYSMNPDGSNVVRLTNDPANDFSPTWSSNSKIIAFMTERNGNPDIYLMNTDGSQQTPLVSETSIDISPSFSYKTQELAFISDREGAFDLYIIDGETNEVRRLTQGLGEVSSPAWSPNGRFIAFSANVAGNNDIYIIRPDGTDLQQITNNEMDELIPSWSSDSNYLLYMSGLKDKAEILISNEDGKVLRLTNNTIADVAPAWGPMK